MAWALCLRADPAGSPESETEKPTLTVTVSAVRGAREGAVLALQFGSDRRSIVRIGRMRWG